MCRLSLWRRSSRFGLWRNEQRKTKVKKKTYTEDTESTEKNKLEIERAGVGYSWFAGVAAFDAANAKEFFAAALQVSFDGFYIGWGHDEDHADAHVKGLQ